MPGASATRAPIYVSAAVMLPLNLGSLATECIMSALHTLNEFRESLYSRKHTLHQLRMKLQQLPRELRAEALLGVFADASRPETAFGDQEIAGQLLVSLHPECVRPLDDILRSTASTWNVSVEQLAIYVRDVFGREEVVEASTRLAADYPLESREARALATFQWWLTAKS